MKLFSYLLMKQSTTRYFNNWAGQIVYNAIKHDLTEKEVNELVKRELEKGMKKLKNVGFHNRLQIDITAATLFFDVTLADFKQRGDQWEYTGPDWKNIFKSKNRETINRLIEDIEYFGGGIQIKRGDTRWNHKLKKDEIASPHVYLYISFPYTGGLNGREQEIENVLETFCRQVMILWRLVKLADGTINPTYIRQKQKLSDLKPKPQKNWLQRMWDRLKNKQNK